MFIKSTEGNASLRDKDQTFLTTCYKSERLILVAPQPHVHCGLHQSELTMRKRNKDNNTYVPVEALKDSHFSLTCGVLFFPRIHKMDYIKNKISDLGLEQWASSYKHLLLLQRTVAHSWHPFGGLQPPYLQIQRRQPPLVASKLQQAHTRYINIVTKLSLATLRHEIHYW